MQRKTRILLGGLASVGAVAGAGLLHNRLPDRRERLFVTVFSEPGYVGRNQTLTWTGREREVVPLTRVRLPRIGSIRLERFVYRFQPDVRLPNMRILWHALTERPDPTEAESGMLSFIAVHELAGMFSAGWWETVQESEARSGVRLWAGRPGAALPAPSGRGARGRAASPGEATRAGAGVAPGAATPAEVARDGVGAAPGEAAPGKAAGSDAQPWRDVLANTPDLGSWNTRTRYLELGYHAARSPRA